LPTCPARRRHSSGLARPATGAPTRAPPCRAPGAFRVPPEPVYTARARAPPRPDRDAHPLEPVAARGQRDSHRAWSSRATSAPPVMASAAGTMPHELLALADWLVEAGVTHGAPESTGEDTPPRS